jgi:hypothetical protein
MPEGKLGSSRATLALAGAYYRLPTEQLGRDEGEMPGTRALAWYGAVVATISLGWGIVWAIYTRRREPEQYERVRKLLFRVTPLETAKFSHDHAPGDRLLL